MFAIIQPVQDRGSLKILFQPLSLHRTPLSLFSSHPNSPSLSVFDMRSVFSLSLCAVAGFARLASAAEGQCLSEICYDVTSTIDLLNARTEPTPTVFNRSPLHG